jgi:hypothetical protein
LLQFASGIRSGRGWTYETPAALSERIDMADHLVDLGAISVSQARKDDLLPILSLFDEAVVWLNQRGI